MTKEHNCIHKDLTTDILPNKPPKDISGWTCSAIWQNPFGCTHTPTVTLLFKAGKKREQ
jgi:hypothetical protein